MKSLVAGVSRYIAHDDPLTTAINKVALVLAGNTPFYPLYLLVLLGHDASPSILLTMLSLPFWAAVPAIGRRKGLAGRLFIAIVAVLNTIWCSYVLGFASGTALFLIPCLMLATLGFHQRERGLMLGTASLPFLAYGLLRLVRFAPFGHYSASEYSSLITMNGVSVACLTGFLGLVFATARPTSGG